MPLRRRTLLGGIVSGSALSLAGCSGDDSGDADTTTTPPGTFATGPGADGDLSLEPVAKGLVSPTTLTADPDSGTRYVVDQVGTIHRIGDDGGLVTPPFIDFRNRVQINSEKGLLGLAFHPEFPEDNRIFLRYSVPRRPGTPEDYSHTELLTEMAVENGTPLLDSERVLIEFPSPTIFHQAGTLSFGPDGYLYVPMGEGTKKEFAQDVESNLLGGIHRIDIDAEEGDRPYGIPPDNPLVGSRGRDEYYAWGLRNPWRMSFYDGQLIAGDVGEFLREEVDVIVKGGNYGWPYREGTVCKGWGDGEESGEHCGVDLSTVPGDDFIDPVIEFPHQSDQTLAGTAIIGGHVYELDNIPALQGRYLFSNYTRTLEEPRGELFVADVADEGPWPTTKLTIGNGPGGEVHRVINSFGQDADGAVYVLGVAVADKDHRFSHEAGEVLKVVPPGEASEDLSST